MIKVSIQEEDITIINIYAPNIGELQYLRKMLTSMKGEINSNRIIVGDFNIPLTPMGRSTKQIINNETQTLNDTILSSVQSLSHVRLCDPMNRSMPGLPVHHQLPEFTQTHGHRVRDAIQPSHPLSSPSPSAPNPSQHQSLFQ